MDNQKWVSEQDVINIGIDNGIRAAVEYLEKQKKAKDKQAEMEMADWKYQNTKLLMENYRGLFANSKDAVTNTIELFEKYFEFINNPVSINSFGDFSDMSCKKIEIIDKRKESTCIMLTHVNSMLEAYKRSAYLSKNPANKREYEILVSRYVNEAEPTISDIAKKYFINKSQVYKDIDKAMRVFSVYLWGLGYIIIR